jgi:hypothetical protein
MTMCQRPSALPPTDQDHTMPSTLLKTDPHFHEPGRRFFRDFSPGDEFYEALIDTHNGLSDEQSEALNARLILLLANHIGDLRVLREALAAAKASA